MELPHYLAARFLMQSVDVLCDDCLYLTLTFELGQRFVAVIWLRVLIDELVLVELEEVFRVSLIECVGYHLLRRDRSAEVLVVDTVGAPEIRDAALGGHACAAEEYDVVALVDYLL